MSFRLIEDDAQHRVRLVMGEDTIKSWSYRPAHKRTRSDAFALAREFRDGCSDAAQLAAVVAPFREAAE